VELTTTPSRFVPRQYQVYMRHRIIGEPSLPTGAGFGLHSIDEIDDGVKAAARTTAASGQARRFGATRAFSASPQ
jgi:hypothetical protein